MPLYEITGPDGKTYEIEGPAGATKQQVVEAVLAKLDAQRRPRTREPEPESGFKAAFKSGVESLKGEAALTAGKLGLMGLPEAEKYQAEKEAAARRIFKPTEEWGLTKGLELLGGSLPYMAAPIAAGAATLALPVTGTAATIAAGTAAGLASAGQFTGSNLARQMDELKKQDPSAGLEQTSLGSALAGAVPQAALDVVAFRSLPLIRNLFKSVGKELTEEQAKAIAQQGFKRTMADYVAAGGKAGGLEGVTEAGQQFIERLQAGMKVTDAEARNEYIESFIGGAVLGGALSPVGRYIERGQEQGRAENVLRASAAERQKVADAEAERQRQAEEARKRSPEYMQQLNQEQVQLKDELRQLNELLKDKTLEPEQKLEAQDRRRDIGKRLKEINTDIRSVFPARPVSELLAARQMAQEEKGAPVVDDFGNVIPGKFVPTSDIEIEAQVAQGYDTEINRLRAAEQKRIQELRFELQEAYQRSIAAAERKDAKEEADYKKLIADISKRVEQGKKALAKSGMTVDMQAPFAEAYDSLTEAADQALVGTYDESLVDQILEKIQAEQPKATVEAKGRPTADDRFKTDQQIQELENQRAQIVTQAQAYKAELDALIAQPEADEKQLAQAQERYDTAVKNIALQDANIAELKRVKPAGEFALEGKAEITTQIEALKKQRQIAVEALDKATVAEIDEKLGLLQKQRAEAPLDYKTQQNKIFFELGTVIGDLQQDRYFGIAGRTKEASSLAKSLQKKATALKGDYVNNVLQEIAESRRQQNQVGLNKDEELAVRARLDAVLQEYITRSQALSAKEIVDGMDQVLEKQREFAPRDVRVLTQLQNRLKSNADKELELSNRIERESNANNKAQLQKQLDALYEQTSQITNTFLQRLTEPLKVRTVDVLRRPSDTRPLAERPFSSPKRANEILQEQLDEVRTEYMRPERKGASQVLKTQFASEEAKKVEAERSTLKRKIEAAENQIERVRSMGELQPAVDKAFDTFERMDKPSEALVDLVLEQTDRILRGTDLPFKPSADVARRAQRPGAQNTAELLPQIQKQIAEEQPAPEVGGPQMDLFGEKELEPRATIRKTPEAFMRFLNSLKVSNMRKKLDDAKRQMADNKKDQQDAERASAQNLDRLITEVGKDVTKTAARVQRDVVERINAEGLRDLQTLAQSISQELAAKTRQYKNIVEKANRAEYYIADADREAADKYLEDLRTDLAAIMAEIKDAAPAAEDKLLANAEVALDKRLNSEKELLRKLEAERAARQVKPESEQAVARRNIAVLEATKRRIADLRAKAKQLTERRLAAIPGVRRTTETVTVLTEVGRGKKKRLELAERERPVVQPVGAGAAKVQRRAEALDLSSTAAEAYARTAQEEEVLSPAEAAQALLRGTKQSITATGNLGGTTEQIRKQRLKPLRGGKPEQAAKNIAETSTLRQRAAGKKAQTDKDLLKLLKSFEEGIARANDDTVFRIEETGDAVVDLAQAKERVDAFKAKLPENVKFVYVDSIVDAPKAFIRALYQQGMDIDSAKVKGGVLPDGTIVVIGENHTDMLDLEKTLVHEVVGHYGVDTLLGEKGMDNLIETVNAQKGGMAALAESLGVYDDALGAALALQRVGAPEKAQQRAAMRELIAHVEEARIDENFKQKARRFLGELIGAVKAALRKMGLMTLVEQTPSDIYFLLRQARNKMAEAQPGAYRTVGGEVAFRGQTRYGADVPDAVIKANNKVVATPAGVFDKVKANNSWLAVRTQFIDRFEPLERVAEQMKDSLQATQMMYYLRMYDQRMSFTAEATSNGPLILDKQKRADGREEIVVRSGGTTSLKDVANELSKITSMNVDAANMTFTTYLAALRADRVGLDTLNFDPSLTKADLDAVKDFVARTPDVKNAFEAARKKYNEYNKGLVDFLVQTGTLSKQTAKKLSETNDYIPFYRKQGGNAELVLGGEISPITVGNLKDQPYLNELIGDNRHILDFFTSSVQNTNMLTDMALRNLATRNVAFGLGEMGLLTRTDKEAAQNKSGIRKGKAKGAEVIRFKIDGEDYYAEANTDALGIPSDLLVKGLEGISMTVPAAVRMLGVPAQLLRKFITRNPVYALRQIVRDSTAAVMVSGADMLPVISSTKELGKMIQGKSEGEKLLQQRGILGGQVLTGTPEDLSKMMRELASGGKSWTTAMAKLDNLAVQGDAATRVVMYNNFRKQGLSDMEATLATLESMNFNRRGLSPSVYMLSMMVPFMNAQIQGLDVLYRAFTGKMPFNEQLKVREKLITRGLMMAGITLMYAAMMEDDDAYKNADPADRALNFFVKTPFFDEPVRVPIPFEIGYIFKSLPEMVYNTMFGDTELGQVAPAIRKILTSLVPGDLPAGIKPMIELMTNYSFYSGKAIESEREQGLVPEERYRAKTTEVSKLIGQLFGISPIKLDYAVRGYTGGLGLAVLSIANPVLAADEKVSPEMRASDTPVVGGLFQPRDAQGLINYAYELVDSVEKRQRTLKELEKTGTEASVIAFEKENVALLDMTKDAGRFKKKMGDFAKEEREIRADPNMTPAEKRKELDDIRQERIELAKALVADVAESKRLAAR